MPTAPSQASLAEQIDALEELTTTELVNRYAELFGQSVRTRHRAYLLRKLAWRIQALAEGDLSARARQRAAELADDAAVRVMPPRAPAEATTPRSKPAPAHESGADGRLPAPGAALVRQYKGKTVRVLVEADGFAYQGQRYKSLTAVAQAITGSHLNGYRFFGLEKKP